MTICQYGFCINRGDTPMYVYSPYGLATALFQLGLIEQEDYSLVYEYWEVNVFHVEDIAENNPYLEGFAGT